jgi:hypothetical protein
MTDPIAQGITYEPIKQRQGLAYRRLQDPIARRTR